MQKKESFFEMHGFTDPYGRKRTVTGGSFCPYKSIFIRICPFISKMPFDECSAAMGFEVEKLSGNAAL